MLTRHQAALALGRHNLITKNEMIVIIKRTFSCGRGGRSDKKTRRQDTCKCHKRQGMWVHHFFFPSAVASGYSRCSFTQGVHFIFSNFCLLDHDDVWCVALGARVCPTTGGNARCTHFTRACIYCIYVPVYTYIEFMFLF